MLKSCGDSEAAEELLKRFHAFEQTEDLFSLRIGDIYVWPVVRLRVQRLMMLEHGLSDLGPKWGKETEAQKKSTTSQVSPMRSWFRLMHHLAFAIWRHPVWRFRRVSWVLRRWGTARNRPIEGVLRDPVSWPLEKELRTMDCVHVLNGDDEPGDWRESLSQYEGFADFMALRLFPNDFRKAGILCLNAAEREELKKLASKCQKNLNLSSDCGRMITQDIEHFRMARFVWRWLFRWIKPSHLVLVVAYARQELVAAAKDLGIPVIELQHGTITPGHLGYHYPGSPVVPYFPDLVLTWGKAWAQGIELPAGARFVVAGSGWMQRRLAGQDNVQKEAKLGIFISQPGITLRLLDRAEALARLRPDWQWVFCPHPNEKITAVRARMAEESFPANLRLPEEGQNTMSFQAHADVQIGNCSTALWEGVSLGCRTVLLRDFPMTELYMQSLMKATQSAAMVEDVAEISVALDSLPYPEKGDADDLFAPPVPSMVELIERELAG